MERLFFPVLVAMFLAICGPGLSPSAAQDIKPEFSAASPERFKAAGIVWRSHFGYRKEEPDTFYFLMIKEGFNAHISKNFDSLISSWLGEHEKAEAVVVYTLDGVMTARPQSKFKTVWIVDGDENLNIYLVRAGGCRARTMLLTGGDKTPLTSDTYEAFAKKVTEAEELAQREKLGIWKKH